MTASDLESTWRSKLSEHGLRCLQTASAWAARGYTPILLSRYGAKVPLNTGWPGISLDEWIERADEALVTLDKNSQGRGGLDLNLSIKLNDKGLCLDVDKDLKTDGRDGLLTALFLKAGHGEEEEEEEAEKWKQQKWDKMIETALYVEKSPSGGWHFIWRRPSVWNGGTQVNFMGTKCDYISGSTHNLNIAPTRYVSCAKKNKPHKKCGEAVGAKCKWQNQEYLIVKDYDEKAGNIPEDLLLLMMTKPPVQKPSTTKRKKNKEVKTMKKQKLTPRTETKELSTVVCDPEAMHQLYGSTVHNFLQLLPPQTSIGLTLDEKTWKQLGGIFHVRMSAVGDGWLCSCCEKTHHHNGAGFKLTILAGQNIYECCLICLKSNGLVIRKLMWVDGHEATKEEQDDDVVLEDGKEEGLESHGLDPELWNHVYKLDATKELRASLFCVKTTFEGKAEFPSIEPGTRGLVWDEKQALWVTCTINALIGKMKKECCKHVREQEQLVAELLLQRQFQENLVEIAILERVQRRLHGIKTQLKTEAGMKNTLKSIQLELVGTTMRDKMNQMDDLLPCRPHLVVDLRSGTVRQRKFHDYFTMESPVRWLTEDDIDSEEVKTKKLYLLHGFKRMCGAPEQIISDDEKVEETEWKQRYDALQLILGYAITGSTQFKNWFFFHQPGSNGGKSTLTELMNRVLGPFFDAVNTDVLVREKGTKMMGIIGGHNSGLARLANKRCGMSNEVKQGSVLEERTILSLSGFDLQSARPVGKEEIQFKSKVKLMLLANDWIEIDFSHEALSRRVIWLTLPIRFVEHPERENERLVDPEWRDKMEQDPIIHALFLRWLLVGSQRSYRLTGSTLRDHMPKFIQDANTELRQENKSPLWEYIHDPEVFVHEPGSAVLLKEFMEDRPTNLTGLSKTEIRSEMDRLEIVVKMNHAISRRSGRRCKQLCVVGLDWTPGLKFTAS